MGFKDVIQQESSENSAPAFIRGITALGICFSWLELIFMIGRYPFRGGVFSVMFYSCIDISKKKETFHQKIFFVFYAFP